MADTLSQRVGSTTTVYPIAIRDSSVTTRTDEIIDRFHSPLRTTHRDPRTRRNSETSDAGPHSAGAAG